MYPFYVLGLPHDVDDEQVEEAYHAQIQLFPPDRAPDEFPLIRKAYEALCEPLPRTFVQLRHFDESGEALMQPVPRLSKAAPRRLTTAEVAAWLCEGEGP